MKVAVDSNVLLYAEGLNGVARRNEMENLFRRLLGSICLPPQVLGEFYRVLTSKGGYSPVRAAARVQHWARALTVAEADGNYMLDAIELASRHQLHIWDAAVVAYANRAGCGVLLSEDMQHGFRWRGVTVVNPFLRPRPESLIEMFEAP